MKRSRLLLTGLGAALTMRARQRQRASSARSGAPASGAGLEHPDDVLAVLHADHIQLREMVADLQARPGGRLEEHRAAVRQLQRLVMTATGHETVEELHLWPLVSERLPGGAGLAEAAREQELEQTRLLQRLDGRRPGDVDYDDLLTEFAHRAASHIAYEETMVWPVLRETLGPHERRDVGRQIVRAKRVAPTRPHPSAPATPGRHRLLGRSLALLDRNLDRLTARGR
jgi:hypothetical protein